MARVIYSLVDGSETTIEGAAGDSVMQLAMRNGVSGILAQCGGTLSCATCHVYVNRDDFDALSPISEFEEEMLETTSSDREDCSRLSCQLVLAADQTVRVTMPKAQL
ncbi:2Fe-2S iron-sulfur cluster-binding protein [Pseudarthrobacter sp. NPDC058329]|uniref:2Fe-2S iron-sulfur cluster-binding protein n=1 Tax=Pseudarthrobacter sp. NPDC058329 TaxID=3346448 RepID=UPI0036DB1F30